MNDRNPEPESPKSMVEINLRYEGELRTTATHAPSGATLHTDAPVDNCGRGESFSPTDLVATALGSCLFTILGIKAQQKGIALQGGSVRVQKEMSADAPRRIARLTVEIEVPLPEDHPDRKVLEAAALACPVHHSLHPDMEKAVTFRWVG